MQLSQTNSRNPGQTDLEIQISQVRGSEGLRLDYVLNSPSGAVRYHQQKVRGQELHSPERFQRRLLAQLGNLTRGLDVDGQPILKAEIQEELRSIGRDLYRAVFPSELRTIYRSIRDQVDTLLITTDEAWIPWEILHPTDSDDPDADDDTAFFCLRHAMTRWLKGEASLSSDQRIQRLLHVTANGSQQLAEVEPEANFFNELANQIPGLTASTHSDVEFQQFGHLLESESFDLLHFSGHGQHDSERPGEAKVLGDERSFRARHISAAAERKLRRERPVVFFNSCEVGQLDQSLTELDGWAQRWVQNCKCSAFIAPAWSVRDGGARRFAELFYTYLADGLTLAKAAQQARYVLMCERPGEMDWLAYRLYGSPTAHLFFGELPANQPELRTAATPSLTVRVSQPAIQPASPPAREPVRAAAQPTTTVMILTRWRYMAMVLAIVLALAWTLTQLRTPDGSSGVAREHPNLAEETKQFGEDDGTPSQNYPETPPPTEPTTQPIATTTQSKPTKNSLPLSQTIPGKIAVIALNQANQQSDWALASAIRSALLEAGTTGAIEIPKVDSNLSLQLVRGGFTPTSKSGQTLWGAEFLLVASGSQSPLSQSSAPIRSVSMSLTTELLRADNGASLAHARDSHTGTGNTMEAALAQAASRCLRSISSQLN